MIRLIKLLFLVLCLAAVAITACSNPPSGSEDSTPTGAAYPIASVVPTATLAPYPVSTSTATTTPVPSLVPTGTATVTPLDAIPVYSYRVINRYPHDRDAFTQGLVIMDGVMYEGTGLRGRSSLRRVDWETGDVLQLYELPEQFFGEGVTVFGDEIIQLTWQSHAGFVYDRDSFELLQEFNYPTEGWGLTHDGEQLIMSDGTATLYFLDLETLTESGRVDVYDDNGPVVRLNELEYINGQIYANVWQTNRIAIILPQTGQVTGWIDLTGLLNAEGLDQPVDVLNGIAYDAENGRLFVTGKLWPTIFEIELVPQE